MMDLVAILLGLCFGSFLNVVIIRIPQNKSIILPPSSCHTLWKKAKAISQCPPPIVYIPKGEMWILQG